MSGGLSVKSVTREFLKWAGRPPRPARKRLHGRQPPGVSSWQAHDAGLRLLVAAAPVFDGRKAPGWWGIVCCLRTELWSMRGEAPGSLARKCEGPLREEPMFRLGEELESWWAGLLPMRLMG
jgi:hypothetical protein